jgi:hypothetical protein
MNKFFVGLMLLVPVVVPVLGDLFFRCTLGALKNALK